MKRKFIVAMLIILCFAPLAVMAQHTAVDKGSLELGVGNIFELQIRSSDNYDDYNKYSIGATPNLTAGYFVIDSLMIGTTIYFKSYKDESMTDPDTDLFIKPEIKYYFPVSEKVLINVKGFFGIYSEKYSYDAIRYKWTRMRFGGGATVTYLLLPTLGASIGADLTIYPDGKIDGTSVPSTDFKKTTISIGLTAYL